MENVSIGASLSLTIGSAGEGRRCSRFVGVGDRVTFAAKPPVDCHGASFSTAAY